MIAFAHFSTSPSSSLGFNVFFLRRDCGLTESVVLLSLALLLLFLVGSFSACIGLSSFSASSSFLLFSGGSDVVLVDNLLSISEVMLLFFVSSSEGLGLSTTCPDSLSSCSSSSLSSSSSSWSEWQAKSKSLLSSSSASRTFRSTVWRRDLRIGRPLTSLSGDCYSHNHNNQ